MFRILTREDTEDESLLSYLSFIRPTSFISQSHRDNQSESTTKFYNSSKTDVIVHELCESRGGRPGLSVLTSLLVSVDVENY